MIGYAVLGGFVLDAIFGDPAWLPHPVVYTSNLFRLRVVGDSRLHGKTIIELDIRSMD